MIDCKSRCTLFNKRYIITMNTPFNNINILKKPFEHVVARIVSSNYVLVN